jgi:hypothetical protein
MLKSLYVCATTAALALSASSGHAMSINIGAGRFALMSVFSAR